MILFLNDSCVAHNGVRKQNTLRQQYHLLMSFNEKTISVNNGVIHKKRHKVNQRGGNNIPVDNIIY